MAVMGAARFRVMAKAKVTLFGARNRVQSWLGFLVE